MRLLHTADVHLREDDDRTIEALKTVLDTAAENEVDLVTIGGDLFDSPGDANALRPRLRGLFSDNDFDVVVIPGNHDADVYRDNLEFGQDLEVLVDDPLERREFEDVRITGVPYQSELTEELFSALSLEGTSDRAQLLLLHCTLDIGFGADATGEEAATEYFPVTKSTLASLGYDIVLAGHIHSTVRTLPLAHGGTFVYPGSPVSHSTSETGRRHAVLVDTETEAIRSLPLATYFVDRLERTVRPGEEDKVLDEVEAWVHERDEVYADLTIDIEGFIEREEAAFRADLEHVAGEATIEYDGVRGVAEVLEHPLYRDFERELDDDIEDRTDIETRVIRVLSELLANREIRQ